MAIISIIINNRFAVFIILFLIISCSDAKQNAKPYFKVLDAKTAALEINTYDVKGQFIRKIKLKINNKRMTDQFAFVNSCPQRGIITALKYGKAFEIVTIHNDEMHKVICIK